MRREERTRGRGGERWRRKNDRIKDLIVRYAVNLYYIILLLINFTDR